MKKLILLAFILTAAVSQAKEEKACPYRSGAGLHAKTAFDKSAGSNGTRQTPVRSVRTQR